MALSYDFSHDFAGKGMLSVLGGVLRSDICCFGANYFLTLTLGCKLASCASRPIKGNQKITDKDHLKQVLNSFWDVINQELINDATHQFLPFILACFIIYFFNFEEAMGFSHPEHLGMC